ncbi:MAG TPA: SDR family NAD(P)-dependent oxidoreductase [Gemmataceae bacterium]|jgi:3-oxoacyl-[acyl-carrier protein] reductase|nr:SDR family NAD(P)-dependent oxidoreductase [Gemmataceae bacterium]
MIRYDFTGKVVLVTGSSRGMGAATLEMFGRAGAVCLLQYFDDPGGDNRRDAEATAERIRATGATVHLVEGDVRRFEAVDAVMKRSIAVAGKLDILVNNAGIIRDHTVKKMTLDEWHAVIQTNLDGVFYCSKLAAELLPSGGRIVNVSSVAGLFPFHGQANYAAAKAGVIALTKVLAKELARRGITVNAVAPGVIQTPMIEQIRPEVMAEYQKQIPLGRAGRPEDVANAILFLASEESEYITGQTLPITGGWF